MTKIENEMQYNSAMERINQLLKEVNDNTPEDDPTSTSAVIIADSDETDEEAYELGYQNGLQDGESGTLSY